MKLLPKNTYTNEQMATAILLTEHFVHDFNCDTEGFYSKYSPDGFVYYTQLCILNEDDVHTANCAVFCAKENGYVQFSEYTDYNNAVIGITLKYIKRGNAWVPDPSNPDGEIVLKDIYEGFFNISQQSDFSDDIQF